jgi:hypothetical protein
VTTPPRTRPWPRSGPLSSRCSSSPTTSCGHAESALELAPDDLGRRAAVSRPFTPSIAGRYFDQALATYTDILEKAPLDAATYRALRHLFTSVKWGDATWCCCQALSAIGQALPDEQAFFLRMRAQGPTVAQARLDDDVWQRASTPPRRRAAPEPHSSP